MKKIFLSFHKNSQVSTVPLLLFKLGVSICVICQAFGYLMDADLIFSKEGLLPDFLVREYYPSGFFGFGESLGILACLALMALAFASAFKKLQFGSFLLISLIEIFLLRRNFPFVNAGDSALVYLSLMAAFTPNVSWREKKASISLSSLLPLFALNSVMYLINFGAKISSRWITGEGLTDSINHLELSRLPLLSQYSLALKIFDYLAILLILIAIFIPWISFERYKLRNRAALAVIIYHLAANLLFKLSWISIPFIVFELSLLVPASENANASVVPNLAWKTKTAWILLLLGFFGIKDPADISAFSGSGALPVGHNWYMFAPPPPSTSIWKVDVQVGNEEKSVPIEKVFQNSPFFVFQHEYKFLNNLRRSEFLPVSEHFSKWICRNLSEPKLQSVQLHYQVYVFQSKETFKVEYPEIPCP